MKPRLSKRILATIERHGMIRPGDRVAVAASGGGDSIALLFLLEELREKCGVTLAVAHFNHQLRGEAADADERFVRELAAEHGLECLVRSEDVAGAAKRAGTNVEEEARKQRYAFFRELVRSGQATRVATGHTADDQAETVLARLARGTGLRGLAGILPVMGPMVRPLLEVRRKELREYLARRQQPWREDETNLDASRVRARIRQRLVPAMESEFGERVVERVARLAELARKDEALLDELVEERFDSLIEREGAEIAVRARDLADPWPECRSGEAREALATRLTRRAAREAKRNLRGLTHDHVTRVLDLARKGTSGNRVELPGGLVVERVLERLIFSTKAGPGRVANRTVSYAYSANLRPEGETTVEIAETGKRLRLKLIDWPPRGRETCGEWTGALDADRVEAPLVVRNWLPGDAYRPCGRGHAEKLKRLLLEQRIAGKDRMGWPVLTSAGRLIWASGLPVAAEFAAGPETRRALLVGEDKSEGGQPKPAGEAKSRFEASNSRKRGRVSGGGGVADPERG